MKDSLEKLAARLACLQNNVDMYTIEGADCDAAGDMRQARRYNLAIDQLECELHGIMEACAALGCFVQLDGPELHRTCTLRVSATYTSHAKQRNLERKAS